jgi:hypothetical protein
MTTINSLDVLAGKLRDEDWSVLNELCFANRGSQYPM